EHVSRGGDARTTFAGGVITSGSFDLRNGLNDLRSRGRRGIEESARRGCGDGEPEPWQRHGETEVRKYGSDATTLGDHSQEWLHAKNNPNCGTRAGAGREIYGRRDERNVRLESRSEEPGRA